MNERLIRGAERRRRESYAKDAKGNSKVFCFTFFMNFSVTSVRPLRLLRSAVRPRLLSTPA